MIGTLYIWRHVMSTVSKFLGSLPKIHRHQTTFTTKVVHYAVETSPNAPIMSFRLPLLGETALRPTKTLRRELHINYSRIMETYCF